MSWEGTLQRRHVFMPMPFGNLVKISRQDPTIGFFWCLIGLHVVLWTMLVSATQPNLPAETLEMLSSGRNFAWGYATQPPLGVWIASTVSSLSGTSNWPVYMLAQICGAVSVWSAWKLGRKFLHPWTALCAAFVLLGGYSCTIAASAFSGDQLAGAFWSLSIYAFHCALTHERRRYWALTGLCLALGFLSSYGTLILLLTMFVFTLVDDRARRCWDSSWPFLAGMAMLAFLMPHFLWLTRHQFLTVQAGIERPVSFAHHLVQPLSYLGTQLLCVIPVVILLTPLVAWFSFEEPAKSEEDDREFARRYLLWMTCLPPAIIFCLSLMAGPSSALFAGVTNWSYLGVVVLMWGHLSETRLSWRRSIIRIGAAVGLFATALIALNIMLPQIQRQGATTQFPGAELSRQIETLWAQFGYKGKSPVVAGPAQLVRNAAWYSHDPATKSYADLDPAKNPEVNDQTLIRDGGVIVWNLDGDNVPTSADLQSRFGQVSVVNPVDLKWKTDANLPAVRVGMAVVHPASAQVPSTIPGATPASTIPTPAPFVTPDGTVLQPNPAPTGISTTVPAESPSVMTFPARSSTSSNVPSTTSAPVSTIQEPQPTNSTLPPNYPAANFSMPSPQPTPTSASPRTDLGTALEAWALPGNGKPSNVATPVPAATPFPAVDPQPTPRSEFTEQ
ncbi:glycosyltransferase family 39 protein [Planctomicrobium sp. SH661]|uniref:glycosyltransferase family 39 protein n=1 Tax=Planctomicrobium sp. SH661 TaxID=3448124 RepID=UPI003F5B0F33